METRAAGKAAETMFSFSSERSKEKEVLRVPVVEARGYARHHLKNVCVFWGVVALASLLAAGGIFFAGLGKAYASAGYAVNAAVFLISAYKGGPALADLLEILKGHGFTVSAMSYRLIAQEADFEYETVIRSNTRSDAQRLSADLLEQPDIVEFDVLPTGD